MQFNTYQTVEDNARAKLVDLSFTKEEVLTHFNLTLNDEMDNYKHTNVILHDVQRHTLNNQPKR